MFTIILRTYYVIGNDEFSLFSLEHVFSLVIVSHIIYISVLKLVISKVILYCVLLVMSF